MNRGMVTGGAALLVGAMIFGACGADDSTATSTPTRSTTVAAATPTPASTTAKATVSSPAQYSAYVAQVCPAAKTFKADLSRTADAVRSDPANAPSIAEKPFDTFASSVRSATPPPELQAW
jgi:hypothetical protein